MTQTIAIVGGGISGTLTVLQLIKQCKTALTIFWFDSQNVFCKGYAYHTFDENHLLNVRANNMSIFADDPQHFINWLTNKYAHYSSTDFVPRKIYGEYVHDTFENLRHSNPFISIFQIAEEVKSIHQTNEGYTLTSNQTFQAQKIVLAFGNFLPAHPSSITKDFITSKHYFQNAFNVHLMQHLALCHNITIIGSGLTMIDLVISLAHYDFKGKVQVISPHAYIPETHQENPLPSISPFIERERIYGLTELLSIVNKELKQAKKHHLNTHSVVDVMRPYLQDIWFNFSIDDKKQFLRHLRHKWGVARHRAPSQSMAIFKELQSSGQLFLIKGRIKDIKSDKLGFEISYLEPENQQKMLKTDLIVNCTGPESDYTKLKSPLIQQLVSDKLISADSLNYGLNASREGCLAKNLYTLGPPLKGVLWESVAVPEIRVQAANLAFKIICD